MSLLSWFTGRTGGSGMQTAGSNAADIPSDPGLVQRFTTGVTSAIAGTGKVFGTGVAAILKPLLPIILIIIVVAVFASIAARKVTA